MAALHAPERDGRGFLAPILNMLLGAWLVTSAFLWPHTRIQLNNGWIIGVVVMALSALAMIAPRTHPLNALAGFWLFVSAQELPSMTTAATVVNHVLVGMAIFVLALQPMGTTPWGPGPAGWERFARSG